MSAAAPAPPPPPHRVPVSPISNGMSSARAATVARTSALGGSAARVDGPSNGTSRGPANPFPHIRDLVAKAERNVEDNRQASIEKLLQQADLSIKQASFYLELGRADSAYVEYVTAFQYITDAIPRAKDAPKIQVNPRLDALHKDLIRKINSEESTFANVRDAIKADNLRSSVRPNAGHRMQLGAQQHSGAEGARHGVLPASITQGHVASMIASQRFSVPSNHQRDAKQEFRVSEPPRPVTAGDQATVTAISSADSGSMQAKNGPNSEAQLSERFAKLRTTSRLPEDRINHIASGLHSAKDPSRRDEPSLHLTTAAPDAAATPLSLSPLSPVRERTSFSKELPQAPSPTYSSGRSDAPNGVNHVVKSTRSSVASHTDRPPSAASTASVTSLSTSRGVPAKHLSQYSDTSDRSSRPTRPRRKSVHPPVETEVDAKQLFDFLQKHHVLLIDVRTREEYDAGHIYTSTGVCIEPTALRSNMSAEELQEALILSPEDEQVWFSGRDQYDVVIFYDQSSDAKNAAQQNPALKYLTEALYDYNQEKPLNRPPIQLNGGLDAWIDLMGTQSLQVSNTAHRRPTSRPLARRPPAKATSQLEVQRRRHREYNPLDPEEERKWRERARSESIILDAQTPVESQLIGTQQGDQTVANDLDGFDKRFPEVTALDRQANQKQELPAQPEQPSIPSYPTPPVPSRMPPEVPQLPAVPSRPPPAVPRPSYGGVSERVSSHANGMKPAQLAPYVPPRLKRIPRTGLHNFGATCYMNATIQCLSATIDLTSFFFDQPWQRSVQRENWKGSKGIMPDLYCILLRNLWESKDIDTIRPSNFRKFCARLNKEWGTDRQQDAKEFFDFLIDILHEDLNTHWRQNPPKALTPIEEAVRERTPPFYVAKEEWARYTVRDLSTLTSTFAGQHMSRLQCTSCGHSSTTYETFYSISVEIPSPTQTSNRPVNVHDCLASYCANERLSSSDTWRCPRCATDRIATKRITITRAPRILVLHFKRFSAGHSERARKIHTPVDFPLHNLDLQPYMLPPPSSREAEYLLNKFGRDKAPLDAPESMRPPYRYDAYAVTRHIGQTMASGHYIGLVQDRARGVWREFNDDRTTDFLPEQLAPARRLQNQEAYIVFYQRQA